MKTTTYTLELLTPCFCAGADQSKAEIRAPAIRGQLRWWFRTLGGSAADEREIFGGVAGSAESSSFSIRILSVEPKSWTPPSFTANDHESYVWYFASVSGTTTKGEKGPRWSPSGALGTGTRFSIQLLQRRPLTPALQHRLDLTIRCFLQLGAIGLRSTRGLGAFVCHEQPFSEATLQQLQESHFRTELRPHPLSSVDQVAREIGSLVKGTRKANGWKIDSISNRKISTPSPFGTSAPRQTSAVYFRPVRRTPSSTTCELVVFEAPQTRVLGTDSRKPSVVGQTPSRLVKAIPSSRPPHGR